MALLGGNAEFLTYCTMQNPKAEKEIYADFAFMGCRQVTISETGFRYKLLVPYIPHVPISTLTFSILSERIKGKKGDSPYTMLNTEAAVIVVWHWGVLDRNKISLSFPPCTVHSAQWVSFWHVLIQYALYSYTYQNF